MTETTTISPGEQPALVLSHTKTKMPMLGLGTWKSSAQQVREAVLTAIRAGYRHIDLAAAYGNEDAVGDALRELFDKGAIRRDQLFVTSKLFMTHCFPECYDEMLTKTLTDCGLNYLDLYLIHLPYFLNNDAKMPPSTSDCLGYSRESFKAIWQKLEGEVDKGRIINLGVSNMSIPKLKNLLEDCRIKPVNNQVELHPYLQQEELVKFCQDQGITVTAFSPLGSPDRPSKNASDENIPSLLENEVIRNIATKHKVSAAQVLISWALHRQTAVIPKSATPSRIEENIASLKISLNDDDMSKINSLDKHIRFLKMDKFIPAEENWTALWDE